MTRVRFGRFGSTLIHVIALAMVLVPLSAGAQMFVDDFETGTDCLWSATVPATGISIHEIQQGLVGAGSPVEVACGWVTGVANSGYFIQHRDGGQYSGIYVYAGTDYQSTWGAIELGSIVRVTGSYEEFNELSEINCTAAGYVVQGAGLPLEPDVVATSALQLDVAEPWEAVLVAVENVTVTNPDLGFAEWQVSGAGFDVIIDNFLYDSSGTVTMGQGFSSIAGPLNYSFGAYKIAPRSAADLVPE